MRLVFGLVLALGLGLAGGAVYLIKQRLNQYDAALVSARATNAPSIETVDVYVAERALNYGERLQIDDVKLVPFPATALPDGVFQTEEALFPNGKNEPRTVLRSMEKMEAVLASKVTQPGEDAGISNKLVLGMRALAIDVNRTSGVSGFLRPGDRVDVYWTGNAGRGEARTEGNSRGEFTKLIASGVKLIAVDQILDRDAVTAMVARTVTVMASPAQVASLTQAQSTGNISLALVGAEDDTVAAAIEIDQHELLGLAARPQIDELQSTKVCTVRTRRGAEVIETEIPCAN